MTEFNMQGDDETFIFTEIKLEIAKVQKERLKIEEEKNEENKKKLEETMDKAEDAYYKALEDIPSAWELVGMQASRLIK